MTRFVSSTNETEAAKAHVELRIFAELDFVSGFVRVHDGIGSLTFSGNTYTGLGQFGSVELVEESTELVARGVRCRLSGVEPSYITTTMTENYQNREATFYLGMVTPGTNTLVATPEEIWSGRMDTMDIELSEGGAVITLQCEHRLRREPPAARWTNEDQQIRFTGDRGFDMLHMVGKTKAAWGEKPVGYTTTSNGGRTITPSSRNLLR